MLVGPFAAVVPLLIIEPDTVVFAHLKYFLVSCKSLAIQALDIVLFNIWFFSIVPVMVGEEALPFSGFWAWIWGCILLFLLVISESFNADIADCKIATGPARIIIMIELKVSAAFEVVPVGNCDAHIAREIERQRVDIVFTVSFHLDRLRFAGRVVLLFNGSAKLPKV